MMPSTLRASIIRLAHENPELRPHLLPLVTRKAMESDPYWDALTKIVNKYTAAMRKFELDLYRDLSNDLKPYKDHAPVQDFLRGRTDLFEFDLALDDYIDLL
jgi:hypothetical protein